MDFQPMYGFAVAGIAGAAALVLFLRKQSAASTAAIQGHITVAASAAANAAVNQVVMNKVVTPVATGGLAPMNYPGKALTINQQDLQPVQSVMQLQTAQTEALPEVTAKFDAYDKQAAVDTATRAVETADKIQDPELKQHAKDLAQHAMDHVNEVFGKKEADKKD